MVLYSRLTNLFYTLNSCGETIHSYWCTSTFFIQLIAQLRIFSHPCIYFRWQTWTLTVTNRRFNVTFSDGYFCSAPNDSGKWLSYEVKKSDTLSTIIFLCGKRSPMEPYSWLAAWLSSLWPFEIWSTPSSPAPDCQPERGYENIVTSNILMIFVKFCFVIHRLIAWCRTHIDRTKCLSYLVFSKQPSSSTG